MDMLRGGGSMKQTNIWKPIAGVPRNRRLPGGTRKRVTSAARTKEGLRMKRAERHKRRCKPVGDGGYSAFLSLFCVCGYEITLFFGNVGRCENSKCPQEGKIVRGEVGVYQANSDDAVTKETLARGGPIQ